MYLKVSPYDVGTEAVFEVEGDIHFGTQISKSPPAERYYQEELGVEFNLLHIDGLPDEPDGLTLDSRENYWVYRYAWWRDNGLAGIVTSHRLFLLSDSGKTIDSVR